MVSPRRRCLETRGKRHWRASQGLQYRRHIVSHHTAVAMVGLTRVAWEDVVAQGRHIAHTGLGGDLLQDFPGEHFRAKHRRDLFAPQLVDQACHFTRRRFSKIGWMDSPYDGHAVTSGKIRPGVVVGEELAL